VAEWLTFFTRNTVLLIDAMALLVIAIGTIEALFAILRGLMARSASAGYSRSVWLDYSRWLVAGLTLQLAADIVETSIAPGWEEIGKLAAIAAIRTFLNFFLERDIREARQGGAEIATKDG
jgi:uncharacterized membrane protein